MKSPIFSIVIPCYNSWRYMERGLHSLEKQTLTNFEVIFVDDCSTDDTYYQLEEYQKQSALNMHIIQNVKNIGPGESRNNGIKVAKGEYLAFMDSDDWYELNYLELMFKEICKTKAEIVFCDFFRCFESGVRNGLEVNKMLENCNKNSYVALAFTSLCCLVVKRDLVQQFLIPNIYHGEDAAVIPVWIARANKVSYIPQKIYNYFYRSNSLSTSINRDMFIPMLDGFRFLENFIDDEYRDEIEFRGVCMLLYAGVFKSIEAKLSGRIIKEKLSGFIEKYLLWYHNPYMKTLPMRKRFFLYLVRYNIFSLLRIYVWGQHRLFELK